MLQHLLTMALLTMATLTMGLQRQLGIELPRRRQDGGEVDDGVDALADK